MIPLRVWLFTESICGQGLTRTASVRACLPIEAVCLFNQTKACFGSQLLAYLKYCKFCGRTPLPANQDTLVGYLTFLACSLNVHSIPSYLNIIRILHLSAGLPNPLHDKWELTMLKRAINSFKGKPPVQKEYIRLLYFWVSVVN